MSVLSYQYSTRIEGTDRVLCIPAPPSGRAMVSSLKVCNHDSITHIFLVEVRDQSFEGLDDEYSPLDSDEQTLLTKEWMEWDQRVIVLLPKQSLYITMSEAHSTTKPSVRATVLLEA